MFTFKNLFNDRPQDSSNRDLRLSKRPEWSEVEWQPPVLDKKDKTIVGKNAMMLQARLCYFSI